ncbi:Serine/threonine-protein kinase PAK 1 [Thelohanellus kitauei]|uniref:non-specific serine/threonine protein kinase n=1 Tax=Thelohanellus kitauei TaxID=669202 RepID=A0A0C2JGC3_THEKT|nr:Serine/threonine-protein kinase PAK 1 [Thelohanellus kitauei]
MKNIFGEKKKNISISRPMHFEHRVHVRYDPVSNQFVGLPDTWKTMLDNSALSQKEFQENPNAVIDVLRFLESHEDLDCDKFIQFHPNKENGRFAESVDDAAPPPIPSRPRETRISEVITMKKSIQISKSTVADSDKDKKNLQKPATANRPGEPATSTKRANNDTEFKEKLLSLVSPGDPNKKYTNYKQIGKGASGVVYTGIDRSTGSEVAIKRMNLASQPKKELILNEIIIMNQCHHPNIVNFKDSFFVSGELWVVMEYLDGGALTDIVLEECMSEPQMACILKQVFYLLL